MTLLEGIITREGVLSIGENREDIKINFFSE